MSLNVEVITQLRSLLTSRAGSRSRPERLPPAPGITAGLITGWHPASTQEAELSRLRRVQRDVFEKNNWEIAGQALSH